MDPVSQLLLRTEYRHGRQSVILRSYGLPSQDPVQTPSWQSSEQSVFARLYHLHHWVLPTPDQLYHIDVR